MDYPSLSLKQDVIDQAFSSELQPFRSMYKKKYSKEEKENQSMYSKKYRKKQKEKMLQNPVAEECDQCDYKTSNHFYMFQHKRVHHSDTKQHCSECDYSHFYPNRVRQHFKRVHLGIKRKRKSRSYQCQQCQLTFDRSDSLKFHKEEIHKGVVYNCEVCKEYSTPKKSNLARHILINHSDVKPNFCTEEDCTYRTHSATNLRQHTESKHEGIIRFKCGVTNCTFGCSTQKDLRRHIKTHSQKGRST